ncbi:hypothetical protein [Psychrobacillus sp. BL-248-WT-3]|uniref:hypothetical protein n=1 Tax=Psychrobacillus sp. BL-248-WT-3 TaxID=2725306 RepID=UPI00146BAE7C|nr:hypothetical protein [Psychrobacillus sp. BL-248-WT-3]NME07355.1 hypothetical protein [Psychrobacillus sp. BL-248-WT-3]
MITLENYSKWESYIIIEHNNYSIKEDKNRHREIQGVGGVSEDGQVVGIYVENEELNFFYNNHSFLARPEKLVCKNEYVSSSERCFNVTIEGKEIYNIIYKPYIDPGMIYYDADPEEFDVLLYLSRLMKDKESLKEFMNGMKLIKDRKNPTNN